MKIQYAKKQKITKIILDKYGIRFRICQVNVASELVFNERYFFPI
jgi:hypothetical protein